MKHIKIWTTVCLLGLTAACSNGMKDKLFGTNQESSDNTIGSTSPNAGTVDDQLMVKVSADIPAIVTGVGEHGVAAAQASGCVPGNITVSSTPVTYPPRVYGSSRVYTLNGITYFSGNFYDSKGGTLVYTKELNGTCLTNSSIYGNLSVQGSSYIQWSGGAGTQTKYQYYYYTYDYKYRGDLLIIEGHYTIGTEKGSTEYPIKYTINI